MPQTHTEVETLSDFIGREAVVSNTVTTESGSITLIDKYGNLQTLMAKRDDLCDKDLLPDTPVIILSFIDKDKVFSVNTFTQEIKNN